MKVRAFKLKYTDKIEFFDNIYTIRSVKPYKHDKEIVMITLFNGLEFSANVDEFYNVVNR